MAEKKKQVSRQSSEQKMTRGGDKKEKQEQYGRWLADSFRATREFRGEVVKMLKALGGDPWPEEARAKLEAENRPVLSINKMLPKILIVSGIQRRSRQEPVLLPMETNDVEAVLAMNTLLHWAEQTKNCGYHIDSRVFLDKISVGQGWWKYYVDFDEDIEGIIRIKRRHPLAIFADPYWWDEGWEEARFVGDGQWLTKGEVRNKYGQSEEDIEGLLRVDWNEGFPEIVGVSGELVGDSLAQESLWFDKETKRIREIELWYKERISVTVAVLKDQATGQVEIVDDPEQVKLIKEEVQGLSPEMQQQISFVKRNVPRVRVARLVGGRLMEDEESPYDIQEFPIFPALGYYFWKQPQGMAQLMYDLQLTSNKQRSAMYEIMTRMPLSGWYNKKLGGADPEMIEAFAHGVGVQIPYETEPPKEIKGPEMPMSLLHLDRASTADMSEVVNVNAEMSGMATQKTISGRAVEMRQRGGVITQELLFDTFYEEKKRTVKFLVGLIKQFVSPERAFRIMGSQPQDQLQDPAMQQLMSNEERIRQALDRSFDLEYDLEISQKPFEPSMKMAMFETLKDIAKEFGAGSVPPDALADAAVDAGIISKQLGLRIKTYVQQQMQMVQQQQMGGGGGGGQPMPGAPVGNPVG